MIINCKQISNSFFVMKKTYRPSVLQNLYMHFISITLQQLFMILVKCQRSFKISFFDPNYAFPWPQPPTPPYNAHAHRQDLYLYPILRSICMLWIDFRRTWCFDNLDISNWKYTKKLQNHKGEAFTNKSRCVTTKNCHCLKMEHDFVIRHLLALNLSFVEV